MLADAEADEDEDSENEEGQRRAAPRATTYASSLFEDAHSSKQGRRNAERVVIEGRTCSRIDEDGVGKRRTRLPGFGVEAARRDVAHPDPPFR